MGTAAGTSAFGLTCAGSLSLLTTKTLITRGVRGGSSRPAFLDTAVQRTHGKPAQTVPESQSVAVIESLPGAGSRRDLYIGAK
jgi:hypothetical protein